MRKLKIAALALLSLGFLVFGTSSLDIARADSPLGTTSEGRACKVDPATPRTVVIDNLEQQLAQSEPVLDVLPLNTGGFHYGNPDRQDPELLRLEYHLKGQPEGGEVDRDADKTR